MSRIKRLKFIKKYAPNRFEKAMESGDLVPSADEMNKLYGLKRRK